MLELNKVLKTLGLNNSQVETYLFILRNNQATLKEIAENIKVTPAAATKIVKEMMRRGFIKKFKEETKKVYLLADVETLEKEMLAQKKKETEELEQAFSTVKESYGSNPIKITRIGTDILAETMNKMIIKCKEVFEFVDRRNILKVNKRNFNKFTIFKDIEFKTVYFDFKDTYSWGRRIQLDTDKKYAYISSFENKTRFTTTTNNTIIIENEEIANSIKALIENIYKNKDATI